MTLRAAAILAAAALLSGARSASHDGEAAEADCADGGAQTAAERRDAGAVDSRDPDAEVIENLELLERLELLENLDLFDPGGDGKR